MTLRLSGHFFYIGVVFFVLNSLFWKLRDNGVTLQFKYIDSGLLFCKIVLLVSSSCHDTDDGNKKIIKKQELL